MPSETNQAGEAPQPPTMEVVPPTETVIQPPEIESAGETEPSSPIIETQGPDCLGPEIHPMGQSIAETFPEVTYEQIMVWFCNGAEFEDILLALETADLTDAQPEELLQLLAEGYSWEDIWQSLDLVEEE